MSDLTLKEQEDIIKNTNVLDNAVVLSNIIELATSVIIKIAGQDIADTLNKESLNRNILTNLVSNRLKEKLII